MPTKTRKDLVRFEALLFCLFYELLIERTEYISKNGILKDIQSLYFNVRQENKNVFNFNGIAIGK